MTETKILSVFVILLVVMMGTSSIAPAHAAQKVVDVTEHFANEEQITREFCGIDGDFTIHVKGASFTKLWENGKFKVHIDAHFVITNDNDGDAVVLSGERTVNEQGTFADEEVKSAQYNSELSCKGGSSFTSFHYGSTLHKDGSVNFHHEF